METRIVPSVRPSELTPRQIAREFHALLDRGARLLPRGEARDDPRSLLRRGYTPKHRLDLFGTRFYLTHVRQNPDIRFFVAYVVQTAGRKTEIHPRIFYKDVSLVWRSASHFVRSENENWVGKGEVRCQMVNGEEICESAEETTDLPLEMQTGLEVLMGRTPRVRRDDRALGLVLRRGGDDRIEPFADFTNPRRRAAADPRNLIHGGRSVARFTRRLDPTSLRFVSGFEPDFARGVVERAASRSRLYGGSLRRFRILSSNRQIQYLFFAGRRHAWIAPPQATTTELMSYGVRTIDVIAPEDLCIPGFEYHFMDDSEDPPSLFSQIPEGFAGPQSKHDPSRADASPWLERLPVIREFRRELARGRLRVR